MRVLLINKFHYPKGGAERAYFDTARILAEKGESVAFFSMAHPENLDTEWARYFVSNVDYLDEHQGLGSKIQAAARILWNFEAARNLDRLIDEFRPDVAHLHNTYHQLSPSLLWTLRRRGVPIVMTLHDYKLVSPNYSLSVRGRIWEHASGWRCIIDRCVKDSYAKSAVCAVEQWFHRALGSFRNVAAFIAPSRFLIDKMHALGFPYPIEHVPQPLLPFPPEPQVYGGGEYLLFLGRLSTEKGVELLLDAMAQCPNEHLVIAGTGPAEAMLREKQQTLNLSNVSFLGHQTGAAWEEAIARAQAIIIPSIWYENMPYVMLEALSRGKPVIASRLGGMPERVFDGRNGFLFDPAVPGDLVRVLAEFRRSDRGALGRNARESVDDLVPEKYYQHLLAVYNRARASQKD
jgi:glycosyltransferase involved in cell wall biosynthesis